MAKNRNKKAQKPTIHHLPEILEQENKLQIVKGLAIQNALQSSDVDEIYKAQQYLQSIQKKDANVKPQSLLVDPQQYGADGYKNKSFNLSYEMLRAMARTPIIKAIVETRKEQICNFIEPQKDKYSPGFVIRPKNAQKTDAGYKLDAQQKKKVKYLTDFILNCGENSNAWHGDDFNSLTRKVINDSLVLDQGVFEVIRNRGGLPCEVVGVDAGMYRIADTYQDENRSPNLKKTEKNGYWPYYVQVYQSRIVAEFYPWELCFGIRNPSSSIMMNGYGRSELEDLIENVTALLNTDQYNANYFKVGSNPKGILKVSGNVNPGRLEEFKGHWQAQMAGVRNSHKMAIIEAEKMDFISTQQSNKDMEWGKYQEFLIKVACANYKIDPSEIGFPMQGSSESSALFQSGSQKERLEYSKDKGLKPLLKAYQRWLNRHIIEQSDSEYELVFEGLDVESPEKELENDVKAVQNWSTINEIRRKRGMKDIEGGDIILNPIFLQQQMAAMQQQQESNQYMDQQQGAEDQGNNPFTKALEGDIEKLFTEERVAS